MIENILALLIQLIAAAALLGVAVCVSGWMQFEGKRNGARLILSTLAAVSVLFLFTFLLSVGDASFFDLVHQEQVKWIEGQMKAAADKGLGPEQLTALRYFFESLYLKVLPGWMAVTCLALGLVAVFPIGSLLAKASPRFPKPEPFRELAVPEPLIFAFLAAGALLMLAPRWGSPEPLVTWAGSALVFLAFLYFLEGVAILGFYFWKWRLRPLSKFAAYLLILLAPSAMAGVACLGLVNLWVDFRKIKIKPRGEKPE